MPRPSRKYKKRFEVWNYVANPNGFGGNTTTDTKIGDAWADVKDVPSEKLVDFGLDINQSAFKLYLRKRSDIDLLADDIFFKYKGIDYVPFNVKEVSLDGVELEFLVHGRTN